MTEPWSGCGSRKSFIHFVFHSVIICDLSLQELPDAVLGELINDIKHKVYKTYYL